MPHVLSAIQFFPRGGSAFVARALARELPTHGWSHTLLAGSRNDDPHADARAFYAGADVRAVDFAPALASPQPLLYDGPQGTAPIHGSYEDRPGAPDRVFAALGEHEYELQVRAWAGELERAGAASADVLHLHHLSPLNEAAARVAAHVPVVGHLHGTEMLMLERIAAGAPAGWRHAGQWEARLRAWADRCARLVLAPGGVTRASRVLGVERQRRLTLPNGFDPQRFHPMPVDRRAHWRRTLVEDPRGWRPGGEPGSVRYGEDDLAAFGAGPVLLYAGRFTAVKRLGLLVRAYARACERFTMRAPLVLLGGYPGEWEDEHPYNAIAATGARDVFLAGWHNQDALAAMLSASDLLVLPSVREHFGQVLVEAMACGLPVVAASSLGPASIVTHGQTGWLVEPDDERALADALVDAVNDPRERRRRGRAALSDASARYTWPAIAGRLSECLTAVAGDTVQVDPLGARAAGE